MAMPKGETVAMALRAAAAAVAMAVDYLSTAALSPLTMLPFQAIRQLEARVAISMVYIKEVEVEVD
ncbi:MAG: hypothetical protein KME15_25780 [Drouetiella hepatica Uher 2000/2452]|uniref:Uncharacterized protein n=1 Tax=Drouetiella hepatica Uher 2000/2452 TaxID=904376 RepID=A0A951QF38_9CYAN|nr:hypothetical protein [Drouetiella hepatica Uher 2000/2452]